MTVPLEKFGLTKSEAKIYLALIGRGTANVSQVAQSTGVNRRNVYDALSTLLDKGLIFQIVGEKEGIYGAVEPNKLLELIQSKEVALERIMPELNQLYQTPFASEGATVYKGVEGFKRYLNDILESGEDVYCLGAKGGWAAPALGDFAGWFEQERVKHKIKVFNLFDHEMRGRLGSEKKLYTLLAEHRFLPPDVSTNSAIDVFGDQMVTFTGLNPELFDKTVTLFVVINREIAAAWRVWFQFIWDRAAKE